MKGNSESSSDSRGNPKDPSAATAPAQGLSRRQRLTKSSSIREAYAQGKRWFGRYMVMFLRKGPDASLRLGVVAGRKVGKAVVRSRARRLLREAYRRHRAGFRGAYDVVLVARSGIEKARWDDIVEDLLELAQRAGIRQGETDGRE